ncbi:UNVERIFIED_CONTAM: hypothetical protein FKN15_049514 [Acipenser sinensis]
MNIGQALPLDPKGFLLGSCSPSSGSYNTLQFQSGLLDCRFMRMVTSNIISYMNVLTYQPTQSGFYQTPFTQAIVCTYTKNSQPPAPPVCSSWGSPINIAATVKQQFHLPLMVYMEECVAASTPELSPSSQTYPLIANHGWELLDNPGQSSVCSCCTSNCNMRKRRDTGNAISRCCKCTGSCGV